MASQGGQYPFNPAIIEQQSLNIQISQSSVVSDKSERDLDLDDEKTSILNDTKHLQINKTQLYVDIDITQKDEDKQICCVVFRLASILGTLYCIFLILLLVVTYMGDIELLMKELNIHVLNKEIKWEIKPENCALNGRNFIDSFNPYMSIDLCLWIFTALIVRNRLICWYNSVSIEVVKWILIHVFSWKGIYLYGV